MEIANRYAEKYPKSIFPVHKENGGYGSTVNYSIEHATGKYFKTLDGDDRFNTDGLYRLVQVLKETDADVIATKTERVTGVGQPCSYSESDEDIGGLKKISEDSDLRVLGHQELTYKTEVLRKSGTRLPIHILYTDGIYMVIPFSIAKTIVVTNITVYYYLIGREGQSISKEITIKHREDQLEVLREVVTFSERMRVEQHPNYGYVKGVAVSIYKLFLIILLRQEPSINVQREIRNFEAEMRRLSEEIYREAGRMKGKLGILLRLMRRTGYYAYWCYGMLPRRFRR